MAGYPEVKIRIGDEAIEVPSVIAAGRSLVVQENATAEAAHFFLARIPDDIPDERVAADVADVAGDTPEWFYRAKLVGNPDRAAADGGRTFGLVDFTPGRYIVLDPLAQPAKFARFDVVAPASFPPPIVNTIPGFAVPSDLVGPRLMMAHLFALQAAETAATVASADPVPDVVATMFDMDFELPATVAAGRQIWQVSNTGSAIHEMAIQPVPAGATKEQVIAAFGALIQEQPLPADLGPAWADWRFDLVNGVGATSGGGRVWAQFDLKPGTYVALCFVPGGDGAPHLMAGMTRIFTVADDAIAAPSS
ncbi:MAG TPA: hypothetical protein VH482_33350 [Thermomicrobiales bacterium]